MSQKIKKLTILCSCCGAKVTMTEQEFKEEKFVEQYILRSSGESTLTALQLGTLCGTCSNKTLQERIKRK